MRSHCWWLGSADIPVKSLFWMASCCFIPCWVPIFLMWRSDEEQVLGAKHVWVTPVNSVSIHGKSWCSHDKFPWIISFTSISFIIPHHTIPSRYFHYIRLLSHHSLIPMVHIPSRWRSVGPSSILCRTPSTSSNRLDTKNCALCMNLVNLSEVDLWNMS